MANFGVNMTRTAAAATSVGALIAAASNPRRYKLYDWGFGAAEGTVGDAVFEWEIGRITAGGTSTAVTIPGPIDPADTQAATTVCGQAHSAEPTYTANQVLFALGLNQRASFRWVPAPGKELIIPATASNGFGFRTPIASAAVACRFQAFFEEQ
jgi:hypothetical protein